ncbi:MAG: hypothetical protein LBT32_03850 [Peptococcaceae bacterium]|jgi:uncharacterized protein (DUF2236 family)|nr:hypothetical protein [Peptococcaceae bacterium]
MESIFIPNSQSLKLADQVIERLIVACYVSGAEADREFRQVSALMRKMIEVLRREFPGSEDQLSEMMVQILEQRLPEQRVREQFPGLQENLQRMLAAHQRK